MDESLRPLLLPAFEAFYGPLSAGERADVLIRLIRALQSKNVREAIDEARQQSIESARQERQSPPGMVH